MRPSRREFVTQASALGSVALTWLHAQDARGNAPVSGLHHPAKAKRVVQIFCPGGVSHVDTFDYKPELAKLHNQPMTGKGKADTFFGQPGNLMKSPFAFKQHGKSGGWVSDLFPNLASRVDDLTFIHSMTAKSSNHTPAAFQMNSGFVLNGFPSVGSWVSYGLGSLNEDLPAFVVLPDPRGLPAGGAINWSSGFLPATHQGVAFRSTGDPIPDLATPATIPAAERKAGSELLAAMNREFAEATPGETSLAARVRSYEMAAKMQLDVPGMVNLENETAETKRLYGIDDKTTEGFGRNCLLTRRLLEKGVRFIQLWHGGAFGSPRINWDAHEDIVENHRKQAAVLDKPLTGLLTDLYRRGLMKDTLFVWTTEFGRTPFTQGVGKPGRDHHQHAFTVFLAGAGLKPGFAYGESDEIGYKVVENEVTIYDLHATMLHLLGIDHQQLTYYHNGTRRRLTDVHGEVVEGILA
ncbi:MAG TPA: DUF1501 domain-containing protein [Gemmataceae bacterium]|jgi:hypothetical protein|nr:DUF1501 domain-containing protein [Gemmataceae bacterium]